MWRTSLTTTILCVACLSCSGSSDMSTRFDQAGDRVHFSDVALSFDQANDRVSFDFDNPGSGIRLEQANDRAHVDFGTGTPTITNLVLSSYDDGLYSYVDPESGTVVVVDTYYSTLTYDISLPTGWRLSYYEVALDVVGGGQAPRMRPADRDYWRMPDQVSAPVESPIGSARTLPGFILAQKTAANDYLRSRFIGIVITGVLTDPQGAITRVSSAKLVPPNPLPNE